MIFLVIIQPSSRDLTTNLTPNYTDFASYPDYRPSNLTTFMAELCDQQGIANINLWNVFANNEPENLFLSADDHWSEAGQEMAARVTATYLLREYSHIFADKSN